MANLTGPQGDKKALMIKAPKEMGMVMTNPMGMVAKVVMVIQMGVAVQMKMESHPEEEGKNPLEEMENQVEEMGDQTPVMMMGVGMGPLHHQILHHLEEGGIGDPDLFMWYRDLQDYQVRWDNLDRLVEMEEMGKLHS